MTLETKFYTTCMNNQVDPGYAAYGVQQAGRFIEVLGPVLERGGDLLINYGLVGGTIYAGELFNVVMFERDGEPIHAQAVDLGLFSMFEWDSGRGDRSISQLIIPRLKDMGMALVIGGGLAMIGKSVTYAGNWMQTRETQCKIGKRLTRSEL